MREKELSKLTVAELKGICKERGIKCYNGKNLFNKGQLIEAILKAENESVVEDKSAQEETKIETKEIVEAESVGTEAEEIEEVEEVEEDADIAENKLKYLKNMQVDAIVAVKLPSGKVISAKVKKKSTKRKVILCETAYGCEHLVKWSDVLWVRTKKFWPKGIYELFKKGANENGKESDFAEQTV